MLEAKEAKCIEINVEYKVLGQQIHDKLRVIGNNKNGIMYTKKEIQATIKKVDREIASHFRLHTKTKLSNN